MQFYISLILYFQNQMNYKASITTISVTIFYNTEMHEPNFSTHLEWFIMFCFNKFSMNRHLASKPAEENN